MPEPYRTEDIPGGVRIYLGSSDLVLPQGVHTYEITYSTGGWLGFFSGYDELYWNVTGNGWIFPIERSTALVHLPKGAKILQQAAYTGAQGAKENASEFATDAHGNAVFSSARRLEAHEGMTIAVGWPKGLVDETELPKLSYWRQNRGTLLALAILFITAGYYYYAWNAVGRDPKTGTIIPLFSPPDNLSPAACAYISKMINDSNKNVAASLVDMAVRGYLKITQLSKAAYTLTRLQPSPALPPEQQAVADALFQKNTKIAIGRAGFLLQDRIDIQDKLALKSAFEAIDKAIITNYRNPNFSYNRYYKFIGFVISLFGIAALLWQMHDNNGLYIPQMKITVNGKETTDLSTLFFFFCVWTASMLFLLSIAVAVFAAARNSLMKSLFPGLIVIVMAGEFSFAEYVILREVVAAGGWWVPALLYGFLLLDMLMIYLLTAPTMQGRALMDRIEGFKLYLGVAEQNRLNMLNPPQMTPEIFEKYLPYAMALGLEQEWGEKFAREIAPDAYQSYYPAWYSGDRFSANDFGGFASSLSSSLSDASSSGSGGGGSSGGGGGGGGGGGW